MTAFEPVRPALRRADGTDADARDQAHDPPIPPLIRVAEALDRLVALISRELNADACEGVIPTDPQWAAALDRVVAGADTALAVMDEPDVLAALTADAAPDDDADGRQW